MCWREGVGYRITCRKCLEERGKITIYYGESGFSSFVRGKSHPKRLKNRRVDSALYNHNLDCHPGTKMQMQDFTMEVEGTFARPVVRLAQEGVKIGKAIKARDLGLGLELLNSKKEFYQPGQITPNYGGLLA